MIGKLLENIVLSECIKEKICNTRLVAERIHQTSNRYGTMQTKTLVAI